MAGSTPSIPLPLFVLADWGKAGKGTLFLIMVIRSKERQARTLDVPQHLISGFTLMAFM
jgi:hypothetical protein